MKITRITALFLAFLLLLGNVNIFAALPQPVQTQPVPQIDADRIVRVMVLFEGEAVPAATDQGDELFSLPLLQQHEQTVRRIRNSLPELEQIHDFTLLFSGISADIPYGQLDDLRAVEGVKDAWVATTYTLPEPMEPDPASVGTFSALPSGRYTGQGTLIAVLDTGINPDHEAFYAYSDMLGTVALKSTDARLNQASVTGAYISQKIPFAYDYADGDRNVTDHNGHGTHVAGTAAGYAPERDFSGQAPGAQLAIMKIFGDVATGTSSDIYFAALQDAVILGADVITMSLGSPQGFTHDYTLDGALFGNIYQTLQDEGIILCAAAGNQASQGDYNSYNAGTVLAPYTDYGTVGSPASYLGNTAVAAATNTQIIAYGFQVDGVFYSFSDPGDLDGHFTETLGGQTLPFVAVPGIGEASDYAGLDVRGKIALVSRGQLDFQSKIRIAASMGAVGIVIYNNQAESITMYAPNPEIPAVLISQAAGQALLEGACREIYVFPEMASIENTDGQDVAYFSAWGTTPDLTIAPAITAVGDNVLSAGIEGADHYYLNSGTSMATPNAAGQFATILSLLKSRHPELSRSQRAALAESMALSSAGILGTEEEPISVRQQGAGLMSASAAISAGLYIENPLQELGDDPSETGIYRMTLQVHDSSHMSCLSEAFPDLDTDAWYHQGVDYALSQGLFLGSDAGTFMPSLALTRAMLVQVLYRVAGSPRVETQLPFTDVSPTDWYADAVAWAYSSGVTTGTSSSTFSPDIAISRQDMVTMFHRYLGNPQGNADLSSYEDLSTLSGYATEAVKWAVENGIITSTSSQSDLLSPFMQASRSQFATILYRYYGSREETVYETFASVFCDKTQTLEDGTVVNLLESQPLDCTVSFSCGSRLVSSGSRQAVTVTVTLTEESKALLRETFENGTYVEGFVGFRRGDEVIHATFLSFFGDWESAPIVEPIDFRDVAKANYQIESQGAGVSYLALLPLNIDASMAYLYCSDSTSDYYDNTIGVPGVNIFGIEPYSSDRICLSSGRGDSGFTYAQELLLQPVLLRNAQKLIYTVTDAVTGEVYARSEDTYLPKTTYDIDGDQWLLDNSFYWSPTNARGADLPDGTKVIVSVAASLHGEPPAEQWSFPCFIDSTAPTIHYSRSGNTLTIRVRDAGYLSYINVTDAAGNCLLDELRSDTSAGTTRTITLNLSRVYGDITVLAIDYATNTRIGQIPVS